MAIQIQNLDLEEQEQIDKLKAFWSTWGNTIMGVLTVILLILAAWRGYDWYSTRQAQQASTLLEQVRTDAANKDMDRLASSWQRMQDAYGRTTHAQHAGLLAARAFHANGQIEQSQSALKQVMERSRDQGLASLARIQLAQLLVQQQKYDEAFQLLDKGLESDFAALSQDIRGDIHQLRGQKEAAVTAYTQAWQAMTDDTPYRRMIAIKLESLGVDSSTLRNSTQHGKPPSP